MPPKQEIYKVEKEQQLSCQDQMLSKLKASLDLKFSEATEAQVKNNAKFRDCDNFLSTLVERMDRFDKYQVELKEKMKLTATKEEITHEIKTTLNGTDLGFFSLGQKWVGGIILFTVVLAGSVVLPLLSSSNVEVILAAHQKDISLNAKTLEENKTNHGDLDRRFNSQLLTTGNHAVADNLILENINTTLLQINTSISDINKKINK